MNKALAAATITALAASLILAAAIFPQNREHEEIAFEEFFNYTAHFCPEEDCLQALIWQLKGARESVRCAFYRADESVISSIPKTVAAEIVVDKKAKTVVTDSSKLKIYRATSNGIMHNKYCVIDNAAVVTGSFNPTAAARGDYNNMLIINSTAIAGFYGSDFEKLKPGDAGRTPTAAAVADRKAARKAAVLNSTSVEVHFCPEDGCVEAVKREVQKANRNILFAAYSFTSSELANELILKRAEGVSVTGVIEKSTTGSEYSKHASMAANGIGVRLESSKKLMHHKFFVIDSEVVITGSFNPTKNADERNDENIIIVKNAGLAQKYLEEFDRIVRN
ncbi:hypothetical protein HYU20_02915 [Candidatus Woesearchaeota archaeon]|nr:hypothetical protein [Candidatus Woesearchaeota archaeon]